MHIPEAVDVIREQLIRHQLSGRKTLWSTILQHIAKRDSFDGQYADTILESSRSFLSIAVELNTSCKTAPVIRRDQTAFFVKNPSSNGAADEG